jgi:hypothetical protein
MADSGGEIFGCCCELPSLRTILTSDLTFPIATRSYRPLFHPKSLVFNVSALLPQSLYSSYLFSTTSCSQLRTVRAAAVTATPQPGVVVLVAKVSTKTLSTLKYRRTSKKPETLMLLP